MQARGVIETWAVRQCLETGTVPLAALEALVRAQEDLPADEADEEFSRIDAEFHLLLVRGAGNPLLERMYDGLHARHVLLGLTAARRHGLRRATVVEQHRGILAALRGGDPGSAEREVWAHLAATERTLTGGSGPATDVGG